jgi:hypothetical protein
MIVLLAVSSDLSHILHRPLRVVHSRRHRENVRPVVVGLAISMVWVAKAQSAVSHCFLLIFPVGGSKL